MLVSLREVLEKAKRERYCVCAFNVYNYESISSVLKGASELNSPVIIAFGERYIKYIPLDLISLIVKNLSRKYSIPIVLHLDHAYNLDIIKQAIKEGFTSVMYDGSKLSLEENIRITKNVVKLAHSKKVSVEAELGYVTKAEESKMEYRFTDPYEAKIFVSETEIDALAIAIGNIHGLRAYKGIVKLDLILLDRIRKLCDIPLVLHGGSGISYEELKKAVNLGICKLNINTELSMAAIEEIKRAIQYSDESLRMENLMVNASNAIERVVKFYITLLGSKGKA
ncbi:MAG: class II fructose-bisphosphate aldolase [Candidatus Methanomethylicaceae archaeon]